MVLPIYPPFKGLRESDYIIMKNPGLGFNYLVISCISIVLIVMFAYALLAKALHDYAKHRHQTYLTQYTSELNTLFFPQTA